VNKARSNIFYECKKCGVKGILAENVESINFNKIKNLPCGDLSENGKFQFLHPHMYN
jgi:hypothetical protein